MSIIPNFDTNGTYPNVFTSDLIDVSKYSNFHIFAFYNTNAVHTINWYTSPDNYVGLTEVNVTAGTSSAVIKPISAKYMSITYFASVTPFVMRTQHIFYE